MSIPAAAERPRKPKTAVRVRALPLFRTLRRVRGLGSIVVVLSECERVQKP
jgi:hypothetical protein